MVLFEVQNRRECVDGELTEAVPSDCDVLAKVEPVYETMPGWHDDLTAARLPSDLPSNAHAYLNRISQLIDRPIDEHMLPAGVLPSVPLGVHGFSFRVLLDIPRVGSLDRPALRLGAVVRG